MAAHWDRVYREKDWRDVSWFQDDPQVSTALIEQSGIGWDAAIIDVGGGASVLGLQLLAAGFRDVTLLDVAESAVATARDELGFTGNTVTADVTRWQPRRRYRLWHDRAIFHFLTAAADREAYRWTLEAAIDPDGWMVLGTFAADGPEQCSGLPTARHDADALAAEFPGWQVVATRREEHRTPWGAVQPFTWLLLRHVSRET
ncbi:MAG: class I SAM-dependent methyltransferase [Catenulispora sp.]|nr:class I SAM-dependent methyltransferase [Catenulispora sp.]